VHGHERRTKDKQQNRHVYHAGSVQRRLEDTRRIFEPSPLKMKSTKTASTLHSQNNRCSVITRQRTFIIPTDCYYHSYILYTYIYNTRAYLYMFIIQYIALHKLISHSLLPTYTREKKFYWNIMCAHF